MGKDIHAIGSCPIPKSEYENILLGHGSGGVLMNQLIEKIFRNTFKNPLLDSQHDGAVAKIGDTRVAVTTDSYVIDPLFFPGGNIGSLSVYGTVNDLAMCGARPRYITTGFILEEGLPVEDLWKIVQSMKAMAEEVGVEIIAGDTKVVDKGKGDGIFINTTGVGVCEHDLSITPADIKPGDAVILSGDIGRHGIAIMAHREGMDFETKIMSDAGSLVDVVLDLISSGIRIRCMRDCTRGGLASALNEIAIAAKVQMTIEEAAIPVREDVKGACEIFGFDPLYVANEGRFVLFVDPGDAPETVAIMKKHRISQDSQEIGIVENAEEARVVQKGILGPARIIDMLSGQQLPRIC